MLPRFLVSFLLLAVALLAPAAHAQVKASLVAADVSVQPGKPIVVALRLDHDAHWHTYWINAGTGYPTSITWTLPPGWTAGEIQWPTPILIKDAKGTVTGNGYEGILHLPVTLTPPADAKPGQTVTLKASAEWLMCEAVCVPGDAKLELTLPVRAEAPAANAAVTTAIAAQPAPHTAKEWDLSASRAGKTVTLIASGGAAEPGTKLHFFSEDAFIQYDQPQPLTQGQDGAVLALPISDSAEAKTERLKGILAYYDTNNVYRGVSIDLPFAAAKAGAAVNANGAGGASTNGSGSSALPAGGLGGTLALAFVGGLILNLMPCVFPVLGIKILGFVNQAGQDRKKVILHGLVFALGVLLSFWTLAGVLAVLRAGGDQLGWGFQLQSAPFVFGLAAVMLVFALSMSGVFEFGLSATGVGAGLQMQQGILGTFFTGVLATVVATPCSAPFLAPALGAALALPTLESFIVFTAIAVGLATPYLLLSIFPQAVKALPRPGRWMETFKEVMAFPLYATVAYLVWVLAGQTTESGLLMTLFGLTAIALAVWIYGRYNTFGAKRGQALFGRFGGIAVLSFGVWLGYPHAAAPTDLTWETWSPEAITKANAAGKTVYVDFTARWCATCQANKKLVFSRDDVKRHVQGENVVLLKADWTNKDPAITAELARWGRSAVPFNLVYKPKQPEPQILPELLTPSIVLDALKS